MDVNGGLSLSASQFWWVGVRGGTVYAMLSVVLLLQKRVYCIPAEAHWTQCVCVHLKLNLIINLIFHRFIRRGTSVFTMLPCLFSPAPVFLFTYYEADVRVYYEHYRNACDTKPYKSMKYELKTAVNVRPKKVRSTHEWKERRSLAARGIKWQGNE